MAYEKLVRVARAVYERTKSGAIKWEQTSRDNEFQTSFPNYSILVQTTPQGYVLKICNDSGQVIEELSWMDAVASSFMEMPELFELARRQAMGVEQALDELLGELAPSSNKK